MLLELDGVSKTYRDGTRALDGITLRAGLGSFGLLGPNGAGKSTLMEVVAGLMRPTSGTVRVAGRTPAEDADGYRCRVGYLPQRFGFPPGATVASVLHDLGRQRGLRDRRRREERVDAVLDGVRLQSRRRSRIATLSAGMLQRLGIAQALLHEPAVLILDEPTAGLDLEERERLLFLLDDYARRALVIFSTHLINDVEAVCRTIGFLSGGRLLELCDRREVLAPLRGRVFAADGRLENAGTPPLYETIRDGRRQARYYLASDPCDPALVPCEPTVRDAYALRIPAAAR